MEKRLLNNEEYTITSSTTIEISHTISFEAKNLSIILVTSNNNIIYNFACTDLKVSITNQIITLLDAEINVTDSLTIIMIFENKDAISKLEENILWTKKIQNLLVNQIEQQKETNKLLQKIYKPY